MSAEKSDGTEGRKMFDMVVEIIARQMQIDTDIIDENTDIADDLGADSLDMVEILEALGDRTGVTVADEDISDLHTVRDICEYVERTDM